MKVAQQFLKKMEQTHSPLKKLENLLGATTVLNSCVSNSAQPSRHAGKPDLHSFDGIEINSRTLFDVAMSRILMAGSRLTIKSFSEMLEYR